jgi:hypothetical protein
VDYDLAVRAGREAVPARFEPGAQLAVVVDLPVDDRGHGPVLGRQRLVAARDVDDRQPGVDEQRRAELPHAVAVRTAMPERGDERGARVEI